MPPLYPVQRENSFHNCDDEDPVQYKNFVLGYYTNLEDAIRYARSEAKRIHKDEYNLEQVTERDKKCEGNIFEANVCLKPNCPALEKVTVTVVEKVFYESYKGDKEADQYLIDLKMETKLAGSLTSQSNSQASASGMSGRETATPYIKCKKKLKTGWKEWLKTVPWSSHS